MSNLVLGFSEGYHDAAATILDGNEVLFAAHAERFTRKKNDRVIGRDLRDYVESRYNFYDVAFYEKNYLKRLRHAKAGQWDKVFKKKNLAWGYSHSYLHHLSHAAAAFQCSPFESATALVADAVGEMDTMSLWECKYVKGKAKYKKISSLKYPISLGLFYSAMTDRVGLKPMEEEYIMMGMSAFGTHNKIVYRAMTKILDKNLHRGAKEFLTKEGGESYVSDMDIAHNAQMLTEKALSQIISKIDGPIVYGGGVAHNVVANSNIFDRSHYIFPNPGDAGSSLGAAALVHGQKINLRHCFTGYPEGKINDTQVKEIVDYILKYGIVGICAQRAEFGPRALGNRSLLADPRDPDIKDKVNVIKKRQKFRPFAPSILSEHANDYFELNKYHDYDYMQYTAEVKSESIPSVVHVDGTARVHTVSKRSTGHSPLRRILEAWYVKTGSSVLLNTSLNIKGQPMVNTKKHAREFEERYNVKVFTE